jgi:hypothetical protein
MKTGGIHSQPRKNDESAAEEDNGVLMRIASAFSMGKWL